MYVKADATTQNHLVCSKIIKPVLPKVKRFVLVCYYCSMPGHICPKCYKLKNMLRMKKIEQPYYKPKNAPKIKIELDNKSPNSLS